MKQSVAPRSVPFEAVVSDIDCVVAGTEVFDGAVSALGRWRRGGLKLAAVSSSRRHCRGVLRAAGLEERFDVIVDGAVAGEIGLRGKPEIMLEAARRLGVSPHDAVVLEGATADVRAARREGFGLVVGVSRGGNQHDLYEAGADDVATDVNRVRFLRRLPSALDRSVELGARAAKRSLAVFLDYDGTLSPIVANPDDARMSDEVRAAIRELARRCPVAIVSGRDREDVEERVAIDGIFYAGNHGFDIAGRGHSTTFPEVADALDDVDRAERELARGVGRLPGVLVERKRYSVAVHYRKVEDEAIIEQVGHAVASIHDKTGLRQRTGKKVFELEPAVDWNKGRAVRWLMDILATQADVPFVIYAGDDETDEDAFAVLAEDGAGVRVGDADTTSLADYCLPDTSGVLRFLQGLPALLERPALDQGVLLRT